MNHQTKRLLARVVSVAILLLIAVVWPRVSEWLNTSQTDSNPGADSADSFDTAERPRIRDTPRSEASAAEAPGEQAATQHRSTEAGDETSTPSQPAQATTDTEPTDAAGTLTEIREDVFQSPAGLLYVRGGPEGHRLQHVMHHASDDPPRDVHGVFDGDGNQNVVLTIIDDAWTKAQAGGQDIRTRQQGDRTVYTVNLNRRIGFVGGRQGREKNYPECRFVRLVLEDHNVVITAYPVASF